METSAGVKLLHSFRIFRLLRLLRENGRLQATMSVVNLASSMLSQDDILLARQTERAVRHGNSGRESGLDLQINGSSVPPESYLNRVVASCLKLIAEGHAVTVIPLDEEIGTQDAADMLKVSRPYLVKLLDANAIPSRKVGVQRRLKIQDVIAYKAREKQARIKVLEELAAEGQRLNLGE